LDIAVNHITQETDQTELKKLLKLVMQGDRTAQAALYKQYYSKFMSVCLRYCQHTDDAAAVLNKAFLKIFKGLKQFDTTQSFDGWGYRIVQNTAIDFVRKEVRKQRNVSWDEVPIEPSIDSDVLEHFNAQAVLNLIMKLPTATRTVFNMFAIDGYSHKEIAKALKISEGTSKWHVNAARKQLKQQIEAEL
jgi:RNA polymerase sigma-70 factor (ECF subfamily)